MTAHRLFVAALALTLTWASSAPRAHAGAAGPGREQAAVRGVLDGAGLLADPLPAANVPALLGELVVTHHLSASAPQLAIEWGAPDEAGRPREATVTVQHWVTGRLDIAQAGQLGHGHLVSKIVRDSCARLVTLRRFADAADPDAKAWRITSVSALVRVTPRGRASLPLVDLNTHEVSGGFLSVLSDVQELAVYPQNCAVTSPGDSVRVFVGGIDPDAAVCVFAGHEQITAVRRDGSHLEATVRLDGPAGLREIGVTVFPRRTLDDESAPADTRTWVMPILVGSPPPRTQDYFAL